ncbi:hypothetical protein Tco_0853594 [Tanacetum coccineum]
MIKSSMNELFTPFKDPEQEFRSSRKHFKTLSLDESRSPDFDLFSNQEEYSEEEVTETMAETIERAKFLKELRTNTFSGSDHKDMNEHIEKVLEIVDLFHIPNITIEQVMLRAFPMSLTGAILDSRGAIPSKTAADAKIKKVNEKVYAAQVGCEQCKGPHYTEDCPLKEEGKTLEEAYYTQFGGPFQEGGYRAAALGFYQRNNANPSYQERRQSMEDTLSKFMTNPRDQVKSILTTINADSYSIHRIGSSQYAISTGQKCTLMYETRQMTIPFPCRLNGYCCEEKKGSYGPQFLEAYSKASHIGKSIPRKEKDLGSFTLPCFINNICFDNSLVDLGASVIVMPLSTYLNLGLGDDLMPTIEEGEVIEEIKTRDDELDTKIDDYPSYCDYDKNIHIDCAHNLKFSCMIGFEFTHVNFFPLLYLSVMSKKFHNSIMKDKMVYKGNNVIGALMNVPIFVGTFSVVTDFVVDAVVVRDFYKKFYNSLGRVPNRCSSSIGKTRGLSSFSRGTGWEGLITVQ